MSGVEVAGLALGALPLIVSALEHYDKVVMPITRFRKYSSKIRDFHDCLHLERTIFRAECILLLSAEAERALAEAMLHDTSHIAWNDEMLEKSLNATFGSMRVPCKNIIKKIKEQLDVLESRARELGMFDTQNPSGQEESDRRWTSMLKTKIKFALATDAALQKDLKSLRKSNETFIIISSQIRQLKQRWSASHNSEISNPGSGEGELKLVKFKRQASIDLYETLLRVQCANHRHFLRFDLNGVYASAEQQRYEAFRFGICYCTGDEQAKLDEQKTVKSDRTEVYLAVKSILKKQDRERGEDGAAPPQYERYPLDHFATDLVINAIPISQPGGLCHELKKLQKGSTTKAKNKFPSFYEDGKLAKHFLEVQNEIVSDQRSSLSNMLSRTTKHGRNVEIPLYQRLVIARCIGDSVLRFYETPWLKNNFNSNEIYLDDRVTWNSQSGSRGQSEISPRSICVNVHLSETGNVIDATAGSIDSSSLTTDTVNHPSRITLQLKSPNRWLYHLGILLLELAYHTHFADLVVEIKDEYSASAIPLPTDHEHTEFQIACHLADNVGTILGPTYAEIVRRCVRCDFGLGGITDLGHPRLQEQVFESVVRKLTKLEDGYRQLHSPLIA